MKFTIEIPEDYLSETERMKERVMVFGTITDGCVLNWTFARSSIMNSHILLGAVVCNDAPLVRPVHGVIEA